MPWKASLKKYEPHEPLSLEPCAACAECPDHLCGLTHGLFYNVECHGKMQYLRAHSPFLDQFLQHLDEGVCGARTLNGFQWSSGEKLSLLRVYPIFRTFLGDSYYYSLDY